ncbi:MAG: hypothetical protein AB7E32_15940 [Desulfovibrio sp.]
MENLLHATCFKKALDLAKAGHWEEARETLRDLQDAYLALCEENQALKQQLCEVADTLDLAGNMRFDGQKYWLKSEDRQEGPYCQLCYDRDGNLVRLQQQERHWQCKSCGNLYLKLDAPKTSNKQPRESSLPTRLLKNPIPLFVK